MYKLDSASKFLNKFFRLLEDSSLDFSMCVLDHIAYQAASKEDYDLVKKEFLGYSRLVSEEIIGNRRVPVYNLQTPISYQDRNIPTIELIEPKAGQQCQSAWEHAEFVIQMPFDQFITKYPDLPWDISSASRPDFPHLKLPLGEGIQVKFHHHTIVEAIAHEKALKKI